MDRFEDIDPHTDICWVCIYIGILRRPIIIALEYITLILFDVMCDSLSFKAHKFQKYMAKICILYNVARQWKLPSVENVIDF